MLGRHFSLVPVAFAVLVACGSKRAPLVGDAPAATDAGPDSSRFTLPPPTPPAVDAAGLCGNQVFPIVLDRPNFYFVVDTSGSMTELMSKPNADGYLPTRYEAARSAIQAVLQAVGHRVSYGAAVFPDIPDRTDPTASTCTGAHEVWKTGPGDPVSFAVGGKNGDILSNLLTTLAVWTPNGPTPTAAALTGLTDKLVGLDGKTFVFLLTDGAPNCGSGGCSASGCTVNIEGLCDAGPGVNCCDGLHPPFSSSLCLDGDATVAAVANLAARGVETYVIGMPGTRLPAYVQLLDDLATVGGTAQPGEPRYYPADSADDLAATLRRIGLNAVGCDIALATPPPDRSFVNVFFDQKLILFDPKDGWTWVAHQDGGPSADTVRIVGKSCDQVKNGDVGQVQVVAGCPSEVR